VGQTTQLTATTTSSDGTQQDVTSQATWQSSNTAAATVSATGLVTAVAFGQSIMTATFQDVSGTATITLAINLTGTWQGTGADSTGLSQFTAVLAQPVSSGALVEVGVTGTVAFVTNGLPGTGSFSGALFLYSPQVPFVMSGTTSLGSVTCSVTIRGYAQVSNTMITSAYTGTNSCAGPVSNGQLTLAAQ
jgi:Big-like domain-containing protein